MAKGRAVQNGIHFVCSEANQRGEKYELLQKRLLNRKIREPKKWLKTFILLIT